jgi:DNA modification methylase
LHTTEKPARLIARLVANTPFAPTVIDPFAGSGTTLIACEQLGRPSIAIELDPQYCQVIVDRWQAFTGRQAEKIAEVGSS